jgi:hypothetical protein
MGVIRSHYSKERQTAQWPKEKDRQHNIIILYYSKNMKNKGYHTIVK